MANLAQIRAAPMMRRSVLRGLVALPASGVLRYSGRVAYNGTELQAALAAAVPGEVITLTPGDFGDVSFFELAVPGVILRAQVPLRSVLRAPLVVNGQGGRVLDLAYRGDEGFLLAALVACEAAGTIQTSDVEVAGCDFGFFAGRGILIRPAGLRPYIHDCSFHDNTLGPGGNSNTGEAIAVGYDNPTSNTSMKARIENNKLWNLNVEGEAISVKTSDNIISGNTLSDSKSRINNRYGERNVYQSNKSIRSAGFGVEDRGNRLIGNTIVGGGTFQINCGEKGPDYTLNGPHIQATSTYLSGNSGVLIIGYQLNAKTTLPATGTVVASHTGEIRLKNHENTTLP